MNAPDRVGAPSDTAASVLTQAAIAIAAVAYSGRSADAALASATTSPAQRAAIRAVTLGTLRWLLRLDALALALLEGRKLVPPLRALLLGALHQLEYSRNPPETTVSSAVDATRMLRQPRAAGLVNALLRRFLRERATLIATVLTDIGAETAHPRWMLSQFESDWPTHWRRVVEANNQHPPMALRVDLSRITRAEYCARLAERGLGATAPDWLPSAVMLEAPTHVTELPGFAEGLVSVQDTGAQLASRLLAVAPGERVLDACAAPGGKSAALLEAVDGAIDLTAVDIDTGRMRRFEDNMRRLRRSARVRIADLREVADWWDGTRFDAILLDAPCSATGVIRRHPDIKLLRRREDIGPLVETQQRLLTQCLQLLAPGGRLLYCTCSVLRAENERVVAAVLSGVPQARLAPWPPTVPLPPEAEPCEPGLQLLPGNAALTDGFYYACLTMT